MKRGFLFMIDAFLALMMVILFLNITSHQQESISPLIDESMYGYGKSVMNILLYKRVNNGMFEVSLVNDIENHKDLLDKIVSRIPNQYSVKIDVYKNGKWVNKYYREGYRKEVSRSVSVIAVIPVLIDSDLKESYSYGKYCKGTGNICYPEGYDSVEEISDLKNAYVRVVVGV